LNVSCRNLDVRTNECIAYIELWNVLSITEPKLPIEFFDMLIMTFCNLASCAKSCSLGRGYFLKKVVMRKAGQG
jgi:hypothetical protein